MTGLKQTFSICLLTIFISCNNSSSTTKSTNSVTDSPIQIKTAVVNSKGTAKLDMFNNIDQTRNKLSEVGIGTLGEWKEDGMGGHMSITNYYQLGSSQRLANNLAYYLESETPDNIQTLKLVLNLNDLSQKENALKLFSQTTEKTFKQLDIDIPKGLIESINKSKTFSAYNNKFSTNLKLDKSKIDTWELKITTK